MEIKRKIIAILVILLLLAIPASIVQASEISENKKQNETIPVELVIYQEDGSIAIEKLALSEKEILELENIIKKIMNEIEKNSDWNIIEEIIEKIMDQENPIKGKIIAILSGLRIVKKRSIVISSGQGINYNFLKKNSFKIRKSAAFWHYNSNTMAQSRTLILQPLKLNMKILKGAQVGFMTNFVGIYLSTSGGFLKESYTLFMGFTRRANGIQLTPS